MPEQIKCPICMGTGCDETCCDKVSCKRCEGFGFLIPETPWDVYIAFQSSGIDGTWMIGLIRRTINDPLKQTEPTIKEVYLLQLFTTLRGQTKVWQCSFTQGDIDKISAAEVASSIVKEFKKQLEVAKFAI